MWRQPAYDLYVSCQTVVNALLVTPPGSTYFASDRSVHETQDASQGASVPRDPWFALEQYRTPIDKKLDDPLLRSPSSAADMLTPVEAENNGLAHLSKKKATLFRVLSAICKPIGAVASVVGYITSLAFPPIIACLRAISHVISAVDDVSLPYHAIVDQLGGSGRAEAQIRWPSFKFSNCWN